MNMEQAYKKHAPLLAYLSKRFQRRYGGEWEEIYGDAVVLWIKACNSYDPEQGELEKRIGFFVWNRLLDKKRHELARAKACPRKYLSMEWLPLEETNWDKVESEMSDDARQMFQLAYKPTLDILMEEKYKACPLKVHERRKRAINHHLRDIGWSNHRISKAFREVQECMEQKSKPSYNKRKTYMSEIRYDGMGGRGEQ